MHRAETRAYTTLSSSLNRISVQWMLLGGSHRQLVAAGWIASLVTRNGFWFRCPVAPSLRRYSLLSTDATDVQDTPLLAAGTFRWAADHEFMALPPCAFPGLVVRAVLHPQQAQGWQGFLAARYHGNDRHGRGAQGQLVIEPSMLDGSSVFWMTVLLSL